MSKGKSAPGKNSAMSVVTIVVVFAAALIVSVLIQMLRSPDFEGFGGISLDKGGVTYLPGEDGAQGGGDGAAFDWSRHPVLVVGDSLTQGARNDIADAVENATVDGVKNRTMSQGVGIVEGWYDSGLATDDAIIVVCLAHNVTGTSVEDAQKIVDMIQPGQALIMMTGHGKSDMDAVNDFIRDLPSQYPYVTVADWDLTIAQSPSLLSGDGIHIAGRQGNELYSNLIVSALDAAKPRE